MRIRHLWSCCLLALIGFGGGGCGGGTDESGISVEGSWEGGAVDGGVFLDLTLVLTDDAGVVGGTGQISALGVSCPVTVNGSRDGDQFDLTLSCQGFAPWTYVGRAFPSSLSGEFNGSGFSNFEIDLGRQ